MLTATIIGAVSGHLTEVVVFMLGFLPVRYSSGGYHAATPGKCLLLSLVCMVGTIGIGRQDIVVQIAPLIAGISCAIVYRFAPVVHPNHPHSQQRVLLLRKRARRISTATCVAILPACVLYPVFASIASLAFLCASLGLPVALLGK